MPNSPKSVGTFSFEQVSFALLLVVGMYFPSSVSGEHSIPAIFGAFVVLFFLLTYFAYKRGLRRELIAFVSIPMMVILAIFTLRSLVSGPIDVDLGLLLKFSALSLVFGLDLRGFQPGRLVKTAFAIVNSINIVAGAVILIGSEWMSDFLPKFYWTSYPELVPSMVALHKPVLTFGSHALAGLFIYLFFWVNWEDFRLRRNKLALFFAIGYLVLLVCLISFTSLAFTAVALAQIGAWSWKHHRKSLIVASLSVVAIIPIAVRTFADEIETLNELPQFADKVFLNTESNGLLSRYGPDGALRAEMTYLLDHPLSPIGLVRGGPAFAIDSPSHFFIGDSGPLEYMLRGSVPFLFLIYFGLYRFLQWNLASRAHLLTFFLAIMLFEVGFSALDSSRTLFLLPFFVVYLNQIALSRVDQTTHGREFGSALTLGRNNAVA